MTNKEKMPVLTRAELADAVMAEFQITKLHAMDLIETILEEIGNTLASGEPVKISGFGTFSVREKKERMGRNPRTGAPAKISSRRSVSFHASGVLKKELNTAE